MQVRFLSLAQIKLKKNSDGKHINKHHADSGQFTMQDINSLNMNETSELFQFWHICVRLNILNH